MRNVITHFGAAMALSITGAAHAAPQTFEFHQGGFSGGGVIEGFFVGEDLDGNGEISSFFGEVTDFEATWSGDSLVPDTSFGLSDLFGLVYELDGDIGDGTAFDVEGILADNGDFDYATGPGPLALCDGLTICGEIFDFATGAVSETTELVIVGPKAPPIPLPAAAYLFVPAIAGLRFLRRKQAA